MRTNTFSLVKFYSWCQTIWLVGHLWRNAGIEIVSIPVTPRHSRRYAGTRITLWTRLYVHILNLKLNFQYIFGCFQQNVFYILFLRVKFLCFMVFSSAVQRRYGVKVANWLLLMLLPSCGMFISSTAYLPSSFTMYCTMVAMAAWFDGSLQVCDQTVSL